MADWKQSLRPSSFRGVPFHVDAAGRAGGRRNHVFEFPKRDTPYTEDLGRRARKFPATAYLIGEDYAQRRDQLVAALEREGPGLLVHYTFGTHNVCVESYSVIERRDRGRFCEVEMQFVEAGQSPSIGLTLDTQAILQGAAKAAIDAAVRAADGAVSV